MEAIAQTELIELTELKTIDITENNDLTNIIDTAFIELDNLRENIKIYINHKKFDLVKKLQKIYEIKRMNIISFLYVNKCKISNEDIKIYEDKLFD
jgi:hypothetical protein